MAGETPGKSNNRINYGIIIFILMQLCGSIWWFAKLESKVEANTKWIERAIPVVQNLPRFEERLNNICQSLTRIEMQLQELQRDKSREHK